MGLMKIRLGDYIERYNEKCNIPHLSVWDVSGINREKEFFEPSKQVGNDTSNYKIVPPNYFACNLMHVGRDVVLPVALNRTNKNKYVSPAYTIFYLKNEDVVLREYLFIFLNSSEKDRYFWFHCDSSVRDGMEWSAFCDIELEIPDKHIQEKYVAIYEGMLSNLHSYEKGLKDLKLLCDGFIEDLRKKYKTQPLSSFAKIVDERNSDGRLNNVYGLTVYKNFIETKADLNGVSLKSYKVVRVGDIAFVPTTNRNGDRIACGLCEEECIVSQIYETMRIDKEIANPRYIFMWFLRTEMDRYARYNSWGSARENITWEDLGAYEIPLPPLKIQDSIVELNKAMYKRATFVDNLKQKIANICPILIRGSIMEAKGGN